MPHPKFNLIEKFFFNTATEKEIDTFHHLNETDTDFKETASHFKKTLAIAEEREDKNLRHFLTEEEQLIQTEEQQNAKRKTFKWLWFLIGLILLFSILIYAFSKSSSQATPTQIYAAHFEPYRNIAAPINRGAMPQGDYEKAFYYYEKGDYNQALPLMKQLNEQQKEAALSFYQGVMHLEAGHFEEARKLFFQISKTDDLYAQATQWYIALSYLAEEELALAKKIFIDIAGEDGHPFQEAARGILMEMG